MNVSEAGHPKQVDPATPAIGPTESTNGPSSSTTLPSPSPDMDPLVAIYEVLLQQQAAGASIDGSRTEQAGLERHTELKKQQDEEAKESQGGRSLLGAITHFLRDVLKDAVSYDYYDLVKDGTHDISKDMINNPKFWAQLKDAAEITGMAVAGVGSMVATGGTSAPVLIAVALSAAAIIDSQAHVLQALGVSAKVAGFVDAGMSVAGAVVTMGASLGTTAAQAGSLAERAQVATKVVTATAAAVNGTATVAGGVLAYHEAGVEESATRAGMEAKKLQELIDYVVEGMKEQAKGTERALSTVSQTIKTRDDTSLSLSSFGKA